MLVLWFFLSGCTYDNFAYCSHENEVNWKHCIFSKLVIQSKLQKLIVYLYSHWNGLHLYGFFCISLLYQYARKCNFVQKLTRKNSDFFRFHYISVIWNICLDKCIYLWWKTWIFIVWTRIITFENIHKKIQ